MRTPVARFRNPFPPTHPFSSSSPSHAHPRSIQIQQPLVWLCTFADISLVLAQHLPRSALSTALPAILCPAAARPSPIRPTYSFLAGLALVAAGTLLRLTCYRYLGTLFTFDLTLFPKHTLVTAGPYGFVRHPAYLGSLLVFLGLGLTDLSSGGWVAECVGAGSTYGSRGTLLAAWLVFAIWFSWWLTVGVRRARMEDAALKQQFGKEWEAYAARVRWWFVPGLL